ncbi:hypothetical protein SEPCBS119000_001769 [Sporothrix epigloea]|uniref:Uncharacterized protein n=1 Tax=Sporothrix epigloea TaxID=1892477 RepID=A0ABP0DCI8_9PEZI
MNQLRALSNSELGQLSDLWRPVEDIVELEICPSIANDFELSEKDAEQIGWGDQGDNCLVVSTVIKLSPKDLLYYLNNRHKFTKLRLLRDLLRRHPHLEIDTESLSIALASVCRERWLRILSMSPAIPTSSGALCLSDHRRSMDQCRGGILNWDDPAIEAESARVGEMTGLGLDWRPEKPTLFSRPMLPTGLLNV